MPESAEHINLVQRLKEFITQNYLSGDSGFLLSDSANSGRNRPFEINGHIPDVIAKPMNSSYEFIIGEAKIPRDLESKHTAAQLLSYLKFCDLHKRSVLIVSVPWPFSRAAKNLLATICRKNKLDTKSYEVPDYLIGTRVNL